MESRYVQQKVWDSYKFRMKTKWPSHPITLKPIKDMHLIIKAMPYMVL